MAAAASEYLSEYEAERLVAELVRLDVKDLGGPRWERQHEIWERLNIQAHYNIKTGHDEFVTQALLVSVIVHNLLVTDIWKTSVFPHVAAHVAAQSSLKAYFMLFSEATLINLLEVVLFDKQACGQVGDILVNLVDYLVRKAVYLCTCDPQELSQTIKDANEYLSATESDWLKRNTAELDFSIAINSLVSLRYVTDSVDTLDMSPTAHLICTLVVLLERAPWMRRLDSGAIQRFEDNKWQSVKTEDVAVLGKVEAQIWLSLYNLLMDPTCRKTYAYTKHNQGIVLRLKDLYEETLVDQLPILLDVRRYLEELTMLDPPESISAATGHKGIELVPPEITDMAQDWRALAEQQKRQVFTETDDSRKKSLERLAKLYDFDELDSLVEPPKCGKCGKPAMQRCSKCRTEWYCRCVRCFMLHSCHKDTPESNRRRVYES